jgi:hypothetical protein
MTNRHKNYGSQTSFLDLLFNSLLAFVAFFMLSLLLIKEENEPKKTTDMKAEFLITVTWPYDQDNDIDTYVVDPMDNIVCFNRKENGLMHLDRDDLGTKNDLLVLPDGKKFEYKENREIISIRGVVPGEYCINVHMFTKRTSTFANNLNVRVEKLNPYKLVFAKELVLENNGDEKTVVRFKMDKDGNVVSLSEGPQKKLIKKP